MEQGKNSISVNLTRTGGLCAPTAPSGYTGTPESPAHAGGLSQPRWPHLLYAKRKGLSHQAPLCRVRATRRPCGLLRSFWYPCTPGVKKPTGALCAPLSAAAACSAPAFGSASIFSNVAEYGDPAAKAEIDFHFPRRSNWNTYSNLAGPPKHVNVDAFGAGQIPHRFGIPSHAAGGRCRPGPPLSPYQCSSCSGGVVDVVR